MKKRRQEEFQSIYLAPHNAEPEEDYRWNMPPELSAQIQKRSVHLILSALLFTGLVICLVFLLARELSAPALELPTEQLSQARRFVPHHELPMDEEWVLMYETAILQADPDARENCPVSSKWIKNAAYHVIMGQQALRLGQHEESADHFERALQIFPTIQGVYESLGIAYLRGLRFDEAVTALRAAIDENETVSALSNLGVALMGSGRFEEAEACLLQAQAKLPNQPECYKNLFLLYKKAEQPESAIEYFEKYLSRRPTDFIVQERFAEYLANQGQTDKASAMLKQIRPGNAEDPLPLYLLLAKVEAAAENEFAAVDALQHITRYISPNLALAQLNQEEFDVIRNTEAFQKFVHQLELQMVTLENWN